MTSLPRLRRAPRRARVAALGALLAVGLVPWGLASVGDTSAAWSNPAYLVGSASTGTWATGNVNGSCSVVSSTAPYAPVTPAPACTITSLTYTPYNDGAPVGGRHANVYFTVSANVAYDQQIKVSLNLATAAGIPADWSFATSGVVASNVSAYPGYLCTDLASGVFTALAPAWTGAGTTVHLGELVENRAESGQTYACA